MNTILQTVKRPWSKGNQIAEYREIVQAGRQWLVTPSSDGKPSFKAALPAYPTSNAADAFLIGAWLQYWGMGECDYLRKSRGYTWRVVTSRGFSLVVEIVNPLDWREGVATIDGNAGEPAAPARPWYSVKGGGK